MKNKNLALVAVLFTISVIMAFANGPTPQVAIDTDQIIDGAVTILKTDGVAANDLSNVTPATGRSALGLGTMAVATATDYVATDTFTGHTDATGTAVHGLGTISTKAATDYVATSALALRLDTTNASISKNLNVAGNVGAATVNGVTPLTAAEKTQALLWNGATYVGDVGSELLNNATTTLDITVPNPGAYFIEAEIFNGANSTLGVYSAYISRKGTGQALIEVSKADSMSVALNASYKIEIQNTAGGTIYVTSFRVRRIQ